MVDVSAKTATRRVAHAQAVLQFPAEVWERLQHGQWLSSKGPIWHTAIIAGVQAAKRTAELIPFCHPVPLDHVDVQIRSQSTHELQIDARVRCEARTGVEMEALTAASVAALTVYDMCKALSPNIVIAAVRLMSKTGGRSNYSRES